MHRLINLLLYLLFFQGIFSIIGITSSIYKSAIDLLIYLIFITVVMKNKDSFYISYRRMHLVFIVFSLVVLISTFVNDSHLFNSFSFYRNTLNGYLFFLAITNIDLKWIEVKKIQRTLFILVCIQPLASILKYFTIGLSEDYIGTFSLSGGSFSTIVPLTFIAFFYSFFLYSKRKIYLALILGYIFMAFVGDKRAFWFLLPFVFFITYFLYKSNFTKQVIKVYVKSIVRLIILVPLTVYIGARGLPSLNPDQKVWGTFDLEYLLDYSINYNLGTKYDYIEYGVGRIGGAEALIENFKGRETRSILVGDGPDTFVDKSNEDEATQEYGVYLLSHFTGVMFYVASVGVLGALFLWLYFFSVFPLSMKMIKRKKKIPIFKRIIWLAMAVCTLVILYDFSLYTKAFVHSNLLNTLYFLFLGALLNKNDCFFRESPFLQNGKK